MMDEHWSMNPFERLRSGMEHEPRSPRQATAT